MSSPRARSRVRSRHRDGAAGDRRAGHMVRAQVRRPHAVAPRPDHRRPGGAAATDRRRAQAPAEGGHHPGRRRPRPLQRSRPCSRCSSRSAPPRWCRSRRPPSRPISTSGVLYVLAIGGLMVIPTFCAGWASNNKFALLGGMRAVAQSVSYGVPLVLATLVPMHPRRDDERLGHRGVAVAPPLVRLLARHPRAAGVLRLLPGAAGRVQPHPVRHPRGRERARGRRDHRVHGGQVHALLHGRVPAHARRLGRRGRAVLRRVGRAVRARTAVDGGQDAGAVRARSTGSAGRCCGSAPISSWSCAGSA